MVNNSMHSSPILLRPAIAMIELIFAIVVIGITLLSAPLVLNQSIQSSTIAMQQESIAAAATQIGLIMTQNWDENDSNDTTGYNILNVATGDAALAFGTRDLNSTYSTRVMNDPALSLFAKATNGANLGKEVLSDVRNNDIDDYNNEEYNLTLYAGENAYLSNNKGEYLDTRIVMENNVSYGIDAVANAAGYAADPIDFNNPFRTSPTSTNIKLITVTLTSKSTDSENDKSILLSAFSCNIGTARVNVQQMR